MAELHSIRAHLERRYDGPVGNAVSADHDASYMDQLVNRHRLAWAEVRRIGHQVAFEKRMTNELRSAYHHKEWLRLRKHHLRPAIDAYKDYRDWTRQDSAVRQAAE